MRLAMSFRSPIGGQPPTPDQTGGSCFSDSRRRTTLYELDAISERIVDETPAHARHILVPAHTGAVVGQGRDEGIETDDRQGGMSLAGGPEILLDAQVDLHSAAGKPATSSSGQRRGLGKDLEAEDAAVEHLGLRLPPGRHRELHVIEGGHPKRHGGHAATARRNDKPVSNWERPTDGPGVVLWARVVPPVRHTAVRFHGGTGPAVVGVPADELVDQSPDLEELLPSRRVRSLLARVAAAPAATLQTWAAERLSVNRLIPSGFNCWAWPRRARRSP
jgi:hypothetical protein